MGFGAIVSAQHNVRSCRRPAEIIGQVRTYCTFANTPPGCRQMRRDSPTA